MIKKYDFSEIILCDFFKCITPYTHRTYNTLIVQKFKIILCIISTKIRLVYISMYVRHEHFITANIYYIYVCNMYI